MKIYCKDLMLAERVLIADGFISRFLGLVTKKKIDASEGLLLKHCTSTHCFFKKFPVDVVYLSKRMTVLAIETVTPWKVGGIVKNTTHILELAAGTAAGRIFVGDKIVLTDEEELQWQVYQRI